MIHYNVCIVLFLFIISCQPLNKEVEITVVNQTEFDIDSLFLTNWIDEQETSRIAPYDSVQFNLGFAQKTIKGDGSYAVSYFLKDKKYHKDFGYYSNGYPMNSTYTLEIYSDTLIVKEQMKN